MAGTLNMGGNALTGLTGPVNSNDAATKNYVDNIAAGLTWEAPVLGIYATEAALNTAVPTPANGARYALEDAPARIVEWNGSVWVAENLVDGAAFFNSANDTGYVFNGDDIVPFTGGGALQAGIGLVLNGNEISVNLGAGIAELPSDEVGIDLYTPTGGALVLTVDGTAASTSAAAKLHLKLAAAGGLAQDGDGLRVNAASVTNGMLANSSVTTDADTGTGTLALGDTLEIQGTSAKGIRTSVSGGVFTITADDATSSQKGVATFNTGEFLVTAGDVALATGGVANDKLANNDITFSADSGSAGAVDLGQTLTIAGNGAISTTAAAGSVFINVATSTTAGTVGVAAFDGGDFEITNGVVSVKAAGIDNSQLANSVFTVTGTSGTDDIALGEALTFSSTVTGLVASTVSANQVALDVRLASTTDTGVASFTADHFAVAAGVVSLDASLDDLNNVVGADSAPTGSVLIKGATEWTATGPADLAATINLGDLKDVGTATPTAGFVLAGDGTNWQAKKIHHVETVAVAATTWSVTHGLGQRYCNVTVVDDTHNVVIPGSIVFDSVNGLTVTFNTSISGFVAVTGIA
jgi:hypothetical protein